MRGYRSCQGCIAGVEGQTRRGRLHSAQRPALCLSAWTFHYCQARHVHSSRLGARSAPQKRWQCRPSRCIGPVFLSPTILSTDPPVKTLDCEDVGFPSGVVVGCRHPTRCAACRACPNTKQRVVFVDFFIRQCCFLSIPTAPADLLFQLYNSKGQSPCIVAAYLGGACDGGCTSAMFSYHVSHC